MKKIDLSSFDKDVYLNSIDTVKIVNFLKKLRPRSKYKNIIDNVEEIIKADLNDIENKFIDFSKHLSKKEKKKVELIFDYSVYRQKDSFMTHFKKLDTKSCPFCNNNYIYFYRKGAGKYNTLATLEHYYPKAQYPHLSLTFYNLIPSCSTCNSKFKGSGKHIGKIAHPYYDDFSKESKFSVSLKKSREGLDLDIKLEAFSEKAEMTIDRFKLADVYKEHNDIAKEIWNKAQANSDSRIEELYNSFYRKMGYSKEDVKNMIFCNYLHKDDINKRNHSKLTQDILKQFDI